MSEETLGQKAAELIEVTMGPIARDWRNWAKIAKIIDDLAAQPHGCCDKLREAAQAIFDSVPFENNYELWDKLSQALAHLPSSVGCQQTPAKDILMPKGLDFRNGGQSCDMLAGPCACGAWHKLEDLAFRVFNQLKTEQTPDSAGSEEHIVSGLFASLVEYMQLSGSTHADIDRFPIIRRARAALRRVSVPVEAQDLQDQVNRLQITAETYQTAYARAFKATYQSHNGHWDHTGQHGAGCRECIHAAEARDECKRIISDGLAKLVERAHHVLERKQQYFIVMVEKGILPPLAMFKERVWAEEWKAQYCATGVIEDYDLVLRT